LVAVSVFHCRFGNQPLGSIGFVRIEQAMIRGRSCPFSQPARAIAQARGAGTKNVTIGDAITRWAIVSAEREVPDPDIASGSLPF